MNNTRIGSKQQAEPHTRGAVVCANCERVLPNPPPHPPPVRGSSNRDPVCAACLPGLPPIDASALGLSLAVGEPGWIEIGSRVVLHLRPVWVTPAKAAPVRIWVVTQRGRVCDLRSRFSEDYGIPCWIHRLSRALSEAAADGDASGPGVWVGVEGCDDA